MNYGLLGIAAPIGVGNLRYRPAGINARTRMAEAKLRESISVLDFIPSNLHAAIRDGTLTDDLAPYIQAAIDYIETIDSLPGWIGARPSLYFPSGRYLSNGVVCKKRCSLVGEGTSATVWALLPGSTAPLITINADDVASTSSDDLDQSFISGMYLLGNRTDDTTTTNSHGIYCPDAPWDINTQYTSAFIGVDLKIEGFTGSAIHCGNNRNAMFLDRVIARYCNDNGLSGYGYDFNITDCHIGNHKNASMRFYAGGSHRISNSNGWFSKNIIVTDPTVTEHISWIGGMVDGATEHGALIQGAGPLTFIGVQFIRNSRSSPNTFSDIRVANNNGSGAIGCYFVNGGQPVKYLVEFSGTGTDFQWVGNQYSATMPFGVWVSNDVSRLLYASDPFFGYRLRVSSTGFEFASQIPRIWFHDTNGAANEKKWFRNIEGPTLSEAIASDDESTIVNWLRVTRAAAALSLIELLASTKIQPAAGDAGLTIQTSATNGKAELFFVTPQRNIVLSLNDQSFNYGLYDTTGSTWRLQFEYATGNAAFGGNPDPNAKLAVDGPLKLKSYTVATLPASAPAGSLAYASNGRKAGEGSGAGTGVLVFKDNSAWRACDTGATVAA